MFNILPENSRTLLKEIVEADNATLLLTEKFNKCANHKEDDYLRSLIHELIQNNFIAASWADNVPYHVSINNSARTYFDQEKEYLEHQKEKSLFSMNNKPMTQYVIGTTLMVEEADIPPTNINTYNISHSNVVLGNSINSKDVSTNNTSKERFQVIENTFNKFMNHVQKHGLLYVTILSCLLTFIGAVIIKVWLG